MASDSEWSSSSGSERSSKSKLKKLDKHHKKEMKDKEKKERKETKAKEKMERKERREEERQEKRDQREYWNHHPQDAPSFIGSSNFPSHGSAYGTDTGGGTGVEHLLSASAPMFPNAPDPPPYAPRSPGFPQVDSATKPSPFAPFPIANDPPPSGFRVPLRTDSDFAPPNQTGPPVANDIDGSPVYIGSALFENSVHPCKVGPHLQPHALVPYGGGEFGHNGRYDLLPFVSEQMEWVHTSYGQIPHGRRPIEGGYEENGGKLYHALANVDGVRVPGKTGEHLKGANVSFGGQELVHQEYEILCWK